jgi:hypothetical protein
MHTCVSWPCESTDCLAHARQWAQPHCAWPLPPSLSCASCRAANVSAATNAKALACTRSDFDTHLGSLAEIKNMWRFEALRKVGGYSPGGCEGGGEGGRGARQKAGWLGQVQCVLHAESARSLSLRMHAPRTCCCVRRCPCWRR